MTRKYFNRVVSLLLIIAFSIAYIDSAARAENASGVAYRTVTIEGVDIFYREAGDPSRPTLLLLHGFPTSSHMFRDLITELADEYHLIAPDYPGYGFSSMPAVDEFDYSFDNIAEIMTQFVDTIELERFSLYLMDYGSRR
jgi:pimeloyl-ACP methyl ester carboxylesterase